LTTLRVRTWTTRGLSKLASIKSEPGTVSVDSMLTEIDKLLAVRGIGLPVDLFDYVFRGQL
jgi:hypothetical protein